MRDIDRSAALHKYSRCQTSRGCIQNAAPIECHGKRKIQGRLKEQNPDHAAVDSQPLEQHILDSHDFNIRLVCEPSSVQGWSLTCRRAKRDAVQGQSLSIGTDCQPGRVSAAVCKFYDVARTRRRKGRAETLE